MGRTGRRCTQQARWNSPNFFENSPPTPCAARWFSRPRASPLHALLLAAPPPSASLSAAHTPPPLVLRCGGGGGALHAVDAESGSRLRACPPAEANPTPSLTGTSLVSCSADRTVRIWPGRGAEAVLLLWGLPLGRGSGGAGHREQWEAWGSRRSVRRTGAWRCPPGLSSLRTYWLRRPPHAPGCFAAPGPVPPSSTVRGLRTPPV